MDERDFIRIAQMIVYEIPLEDIRSSLNHLSDSDFFLAYQAAKMLLC
jgi:hypothetical protein